MEHDINIIKRDQSTAILSCDKAIVYELSEQLKFRVPGYKFMPAYKNKLWDGYYKLLNRKDHSIPIGLVPKVVELAEQHQYTVNVSQDIIPQNDIEPEHVQQYISQLPLTVNNQKIQPRQFQTQTVQHLTTEQRALLLSPTSSGKSLIFYLTLRYLLDHGHCNKILIMVPTTSLVEQLASDFNDYSQTDSHWNGDQYIHTITSGKTKQTDKQIVISTWQSMQNQNQYLKQFDGVIVDEAHTAKGEQLQKIMSRLTNAHYRIGATGTLNGEKVHQLILEGSFGPVYNIVTTKELIDNDVLSNIHINCLMLTYDQQTAKQIKTNYDKYAEEIEFLEQNEKRNNFIKNLVTSRDKNTLVLFSKVEKHGKPLYQLIKQNTDKQVYFVSGQTPAKKREKIRQICEQNDDVIIVASYQVFSTGVNIKNLHNIVSATPTKSKIRLLQAIGRLLRKLQGKQTAVFYDIADNLKYKSRKNHTLKHFMERIRIYSEQQFSYQIHTIDL